MERTILKSVMAVLMALFSLKSNAVEIKVGNYIMKKKLLLSIVALLGCMQAGAYTCKVNGICYNCNTQNQTATVTYSGYPYNNEYTGHYSDSETLRNKDVVIPSTITYNDVEYTVTAIGDNAFYDCESKVLMSAVTIPSTVTSIGKTAFWKCVNLTTITIPGSVATIGDNAFYGCSSLTSVISEIEEPFAFGSFAFDDIPSTCTLTVPCGTKDAYIAAGWTTSVFKGGILEAPAPKQYITFADANVEALCVAKWDTNKDGKLSKEEAAAVKGLGNVFKSNTQITSFNELQYFTGLTSINKEAFYCCYSLTSVTIPTSVTSIERFAFEFCRSLTSVTIPNSVKIIGYSAFQNCI